MYKWKRLSPIAQRYVEMLVLISFIATGSELHYGGLGRLGVWNRDLETLILVLTLIACARLLVTSARGIRDLRLQSEPSGWSRAFYAAPFAVAILLAVTFPVCIGVLHAYVWISFGRVPLLTK